MQVNVLPRSFFQRLFGICATALPQDPNCWSLQAKRVTVDLNRTPELRNPGGAIRLEGRGLPVRLLVVRGEDGRCHAFANRCAHMGRRMDPLPGSPMVQCCSIGKSTFDYSGQAMAGTATKSIKTFPVTQAEGRLTIEMA
jgi:nitrite reductase/ring-hydroxylating ferredoxin subunit